MASRLEEIKKKMQASQPEAVSVERTSASQGSTGGSRVRDIKRKMVADVDGKYIQSFLNDARDHVTNTQREYEGLTWQNARSEEVNVSRANASAYMNQRARKVRTYLDAYKEDIPEEQYTALKQYLDGFDAFQNQSAASFRNAYAQFSQFETEDDYNSAVAAQEEYEKMEGEDISVLEQEIADLTAQYESLDWTDASQRERMREYEATIAEKSAYLNRVKRLHEGDKMSGVANPESEHYDPDFERKSQYISTVKVGRIGTPMFGDEIYEYINNPTVQYNMLLDGEVESTARNLIDASHTAYNWDNPFDDGESYHNEANYAYMRKDEVAIYNYYYATGGKEAAQKYLDNIQETLNYRKAVETYGNLKDKPVLELVFGVEAGLDQFTSGINNLFKLNDSYIPSTDTQITSGMVREDLADTGPKLPDWLGGASLGQASYDTVTTTANMLPSVLASTAAGIVDPTLGQITGAALMGGSAAGNAYQEMVNLGYSPKQARKYAVLVGGSEAGLQYLLGGIGKLGGKLTSNAVANIINGIDNAFARIAIKLGGNMISEGMEEGLQEILTPWFKKMSLHIEEDVNWEEVAYSSLLGSLTAFFMEGGSTINGEVQNYKTGKKLQASGISAQRLAELGKTFSADTVAYQLAGRVNENTGAYTMGRLFNEIGATLTEQNVNDITQALIEKGMDRSTARKNAKALALVVEGGDLSDLQVAAIEFNDALAEAVKTTIINPNATWFQRSQGYNEALMAIAQEKVSKNVSETDPAQQSKDNGPTVDNVASENENGLEDISEADADTADITDTPAENTSESRYEVSTDGQTIQKSTGETVSLQRIASVKDGKLTFQTEDGAEVDADDVSFATEDEARVYEAVAQLCNNARVANLLVDAYHTADISGYAYAKGIQEAYNYGQFNISQQEMMQRGSFVKDLTDHQRKVAYNLGQLFAGKQISREIAAIRRNKKDGRRTEGKVHFDGDRSNLNDAQRAGLDAMELLSRALGVQFYVFESKVDASGNRLGENGWYDPSDGSIHIDLYAGNDGKGTILYTVAHELTHFIRQWSPAKFKILANYLMEQYGKKGVSVNELIAEQIAKAKRTGRTIDQDTAWEEVVADSMETMLNDGYVLQALADIRKQDRTLAGKIRDWLRDFVEKLKSVVTAYRDVKPDSVEGRLVSDMQDVIKTFEALYGDALLDAAENFDGGAQKNTAEGGVVSAKYSLRAFEDGKRFVEVQMDKHIFDGMEVADMNRIAKKILTERFAGKVIGIDNRAFVNGDSVNEYLHPSKSIDIVTRKAKLTASGELDNLLDAGTALLNEPDGRDGHVHPDAIDFSYYKTIFKVGTEYFEGIINIKNIKRGKLLKDITKIRNITQDIVSSYGQNPKSNFLRDVSMNSIRNPSGNVNNKFSIRDSTGNRLSEAQQEYFRDSKVRDENGNLMVMYHGTPNGGFTKFRSGSYFTQNPEYAAVYQSPGASMLSTKRGADNPQNYEVYLNITKPFDTRNPKERKIFMAEYYRQYGTGAPLCDSGLPDWTDGMDLQEFIEEMGYDYDGLILDEGAVGGYGDEVKSRGLSYVTFNPEQVKDISNQNPTDNPDIYRSARDPAQQKIQQALEQENAQLKADVTRFEELLKLQRTVTGGTKFTKTSVEAAARLLKKHANAKGDTKELAQLLHTFYETVASDKKPSWDKIKEKTQPVVQWLQAHVDLKEERSDYAQTILDQIKGSQIYLDESQKAEAAYRFGSYNDFRKSLFGRITLVSEGETSLDSWWQEMADQFPDVFHPDTTSTDMPGELFDIIDQLKNADTSRVEYEYNRASIAMDLTRQVYDSYWRVSTMYTVADKAQAKINELRYKHYKQMVELRTQKNAKIDQIKAENRAARKRAVDQVRDTAEKRDARTKLQRLVLDTARWLSHPTKTQVKCPDILKKPYADFLDSIDLSSKRKADGGDPTKADLRLTNAMSSLATALERITSSQDPTQETDTVLETGYLDLPVNYAQNLRDMVEKVKKMMVEGEYVVNNMTAAEVRQLSQMIRTLNHAIKTMSKLYANLRFANVEALGFDTMAFLDAIGEIEETGGMGDFVQWDNALPYYAFKRFGKGGESIFEGLMDAQDKLAFLAQDIFDFQEKTWTGKEAKAWSEDTHTIDLPNGNKLTLTTADAMSIYCLSRREHALPHLLGGGVRVMGIEKGSKKAKDSRSLLTIQDIDAIISSLTDRQKQVAEGIQKFMSTVCSEWGNEIFMKRFLTKEFNENFYFPIESNDENLPTKDPDAQQSDLFRLLNISATKPLTQNANNEVIIRNIFDVFTGHVSDMARLNAYGMGLLDYMKWLNYRERGVNEEGQINTNGVRKSMDKAYGKAANSYVLNLIKDVNGRASDGGDPGILMKWMRSAKTASVGNSLRVATLQITSYPRAALVLSSRSLALGLSKAPNISRAKKYCGIALWKSYGFYDANISRSIEEQIKGVTNVRQKLIELSLKGAEWGDAITWGALWNACEYEVAKTTTNKVGSEEFYQEVGKKLREVVYRTQVVDSTLTRSQIMRSKRGMAQEATAFMSESTLSANILMDAGFEFGLEKRRTGSAKAAWKKTGSYIGRAIAVYSISQIAAALLEAFWDAWRDDDDEKFGEKYIKALGENLVLDLLPFNKIPILSDFAEAVLSLLNLGYFSSDRLSSTTLTQAVSAFKAWSDVFNGKSSATVYNAIYKSMRAVSSLFGASFSGAMREGVALWNNTAGAYDSTWKIRTYEPSKTEWGNQLYEAIITSDDRQAASIRKKFTDKDGKYDAAAERSAIRKALRENDPRIKQAAQAQLNGDSRERVRLAKLVVADGFNQDDVVSAINSEIKALRKKG